MMSTMLRKLRIAFSVLCGILCLLLVVMWVRSHWRKDRCFLRVDKETYILYSEWGVLIWNHHPIPFDETDPIVEIVSRRALPGADRLNPEHLFVLDQFGYARYPIPVMLVALCAAIPWLPTKPLRRFSLRTLLIATTLVAVLLGAIGYAIR
jgi:hypothetical protein